MLDLIERLENADGPDRDLDELIFEVAHGRKRHISTFEQYDPSETLPAYTASFDAAFALVPAKWDAWSIHGGDGHCAGAELVNFQLNAPNEEIKSVAAVTPVLCLCVAALKARGLGESGRTLAPSQTQQKE